MSRWYSVKATQLLAALLRIGWVIAWPGINQWISDYFPAKMKLWVSGAMIEPDPMSIPHNRRWLTLAIVFALTAVASFQAFDPNFGPPQHLTLALLPCIGTLALLPSDPGAWITPEASPAFAAEPLAAAIPPRAPPV